MIARMYRSAAFCCNCDQVYSQQVRVVSFGVRAEDMLSLQDGADAHSNQRRCSVELCAGTLVPLTLSLLTYLKQLRRY